MSITPKQEKFALAVATGMSQSDAYRSAFSVKNSSAKTINEGASRLMADSKVIARVEHYRAQLAEKAGESIKYEYEDAMTELNDAIKFARECKSPAAMVAAMNLKQKISGLHVEERKNDRDPLQGISPERAKAALEALQAIKKAKLAA